MTIPLQIDREPPVFRIRISTGKMNLLDTETVRETRRAIEEAVDETEIRTLILCGGPDAFSAGLDNNVLRKNPVAAEELLLEMGRLLADLYGCPVPVVAACAGHAVAAGAMLLLVSDYRIGSEGSYKIGFSEVSNGLPLPAVPLALAQDRLARPMLHRSTVLGQLWMPDEALEVGFLDEVTDPEELDAKATAVALELADLPGDAYVGTAVAARASTLAILEREIEKRRLAFERMQA